MRLAPDEIQAVFSTVLFSGYCLSQDPAFSETATDDWDGSDRMLGAKVGGSNPGCGSF